MRYKLLLKAIDICDKRDSTNYIVKFVELVHEFVFSPRKITYKRMANKHKEITIVKSVYDFYNEIYKKKKIFSPYGNLHKKFLEDDRVQTILKTIKEKYAEIYTPKIDTVRGLWTDEAKNEEVYRSIMKYLLFIPKTLPGPTKSGRARRCRITKITYNESEITKSTGTEKYSSEEALKFLFSIKRIIIDRCPSKYKISDWTDIDTYYTSFRPPKEPDDPKLQAMMEMYFDF